MADPVTARFTLQIVGPMKRARFQQEKSEPIAEVLHDVFHWAWCTRLQIERLRRSLLTELRVWNFQPYLKSRRKVSTTSYDEHLVFVAAANLDRALKSVPKSIRHEVQLPNPSRRALLLLRNIYEHWDELRKQFRDDRQRPRGAAAKLKAEFPNADPWSFTFDPKSGEIVLADTVSVKRLVGELRRLEARVLRLERRRSAASPGSGAPSRSAQ